MFAGFPRNLDQAKAFEDLLKKKNKDIDYVIHLIIDKNEIIKRILKRQSEENRDDDNVDILKSRIDVYLNETSPLIDLYKKKNILKPIDGMQSVEKVSQNIEVELN